MPSAPSSIPTRQRLLEAAARVYARDGLTGATTRAIASEAQVNEVTLFRHFKSKDRLLAAVVGSNFAGDSRTAPDSIPAPTANLRADLLAMGRQYDKLMTENLPLVRTMLGEIQHRQHRDHEREVSNAIFVPIKAALLARIQAAQADGDLSREIRADLLADLFSSTIFTGVFRRSAPHLKLEYSAAAYLEAAVDLVLRGAGPRGKR